MAITIGLIEKVKINGKEILAKIDTGADRCSLDKTLAKEMGLNNIVKTMQVKSSHGKSIRPVVQASLEIKGKKFKANFNLADRSNLKYPVLIGNSILKKGFVIKPQ